MTAAAMATVIGGRDGSSSVPDISDDTLAYDDGGGRGDSDGVIPALNEDTFSRLREALCKHRRVPRYRNKMLIMKMLFKKF